MTDKKFLGSVIFVAVVAVVGFLIWFVPRYSSHAIRATKDCSDIFIAKADGYFENGKNRFVFNKKMNTCLILNMTPLNAEGREKIIIVDMVTDDILLYWELKPGEEKDSNLGLTHDGALEQVRALGFIVF